MISRGELCALHRLQGFHDHPCPIKSANRSASLEALLGPLLSREPPTAARVFQACPWRPKARFGQLWTLIQDVRYSFGQNATLRSARTASKAARVSINAMLKDSPMRRFLIITAAISGIVSPARAQQGPAYPAPGSNRGPAFPQTVSPTGSNQTNWSKPEHQYTDPNGPNAKWNRWRGRGWHGGWRW